MNKSNEKQDQINFQNHAQHASDLHHAVKAIFTKQLLFS